MVQRGVNGGSNHPQDASHSARIDRRAGHSPAAPSPLAYRSAAQRSPRPRRVAWPSRGPSDGGSLRVAAPSHHAVDTLACGVTGGASPDAARSGWCRRPVRGTAFARLGARRARGLAIHFEFARFRCLPAALQGKQGGRVQPRRPASRCLEPTSALVPPAIRCRALPRSRAQALLTPPGVHAGQG